MSQFPTVSLSDVNVALSDVNFLVFDVNETLLDLAALDPEFVRVFGDVANQIISIRT